MVDPSTKKISRRDAMKILIAVAGGTALANIPSKWTKPGLAVGVLPAHAQTSSGASILAGVSDPAANFCFDLISTAIISPPLSGISLPVKEPFQLYARFSQNENGSRFKSPAGDVPCSRKTFSRKEDIATETSHAPFSCGLPCTAPASP